jgi:molecular chaperone GrpE
LTAEVAQLRDLFQRRLLEDKAKNRLYDELYEQLALTRGGLAEQLLAPLFRELLLVVDRVTSLNTHGDGVLESIAEELSELLERRDVRRVPSSSIFDPAVHEAARVEPRSDAEPGAILEVVRPGYRLGAQLLRPARVVVSAAPDLVTVSAPCPGEVPNSSAVRPADEVAYDARDAGEDREP